MKEVLYFTAEWCNPCKRTMPIVQELIKEDIIKFLFIDVDHEHKLVQKFEIKSVPTFILIENNIEIKRTNGAKTREDLLNFIKTEEDNN
jgi:thioredoxin 1